MYPVLPRAHCTLLPTSFLIDRYLSLNPPPKKIFPQQFLLLTHSRLPCLTINWNFSPPAPHLTQRDDIIFLAPYLIYQIWLWFRWLEQLQSTFKKGSTYLRTKKARERGGKKLKWEPGDDNNRFWFLSSHLWAICFCQGKSMSTFGLASPWLGCLKSMQSF